ARKVDRSGGVRALNLQRDLRSPNILAGAVDHVEVPVANQQFFELAFGPVNLNVQRWSLAVAIAGEVSFEGDVRCALRSDFREVLERIGANRAAEVREYPTPSCKLGQQTIDLNNGRCLRRSRGRYGTKSRHQCSKDGFAWTIAAGFVRLAVAGTHAHVKL